MKKEISTTCRKSLRIRSTVTTGKEKKREREMYCLICKVAPEQRSALKENSSPAVSTEGKTEGL